MSAEKILAALGLVACVFMLIRVAFGKRSNVLPGDAGEGCWKKIKSRFFEYVQWHVRRRLARQVTRDVILRAKMRSTNRSKGPVDKPELLGGADGSKKPSSEPDCS